MALILRKSLREPAKPEDARKVALGEAMDALTAYMTDHCPDDEAWEDFDPEIDELRTQIAEELEK